MKTATRVSLPFSAGAEQGLGSEGTMTQRPAFTPHPRWPSGSLPLLSVPPPLHTCSSDTPLAHLSRVSRDCPKSAPLSPLISTTALILVTWTTAKLRSRRPAATSACHTQVPARLACPVPATVLPLCIG